MNFSKAWPKAYALQNERVSNGLRKLGRDALAAEMRISDRLAGTITTILDNTDIIASLICNTSDAVVAQLTTQEARAKLKTSHQVIKELNRRNIILSRFDNADRVRSPPWILPERDNQTKVIAGAILSDTHFDEQINPSEIDFVNGYGRKIAIMRLEKFFGSIIKLSRDVYSGLEFSGVLLALGGDMVSGNIHEELEATNAAHIVDSVLFWVDQLANGIRLLKEHFGKVFIPCAVGNHGRLKKNVTFKGAVQDNWDYLLYNSLAREFIGDSAVTFKIPTSPDVFFEIYGVKFCLTHGNQFRGGSGWAGPLMPIMRGDRKKKESRASVNKPYDMMLCGHFHTLKFLGDVIMNGSLVGYGEFASCGNFKFEPPQQAFFLIDSEHGVNSQHGPIHCLCENEPWIEERDTGMTSWL